MTQRARPMPVAILFKVRQTKSAHHAAATHCISSLQAMSNDTRDRIAVSRALLGRVSDRQAAHGHPPPAAAAQS